MNATLKTPCEPKSSSSISASVARAMTKGMACLLITELMDAASTTRDTARSRPSGISPASLKSWKYLLAVLLCMETLMGNSIDGTWDWVAYC